MHYKFYEYNRYVALSLFFSLLKYLGCILSFYCYGGKRALSGTSRCDWHKGKDGSVKNYLFQVAYHSYPKKELLLTSPSLNIRR